MLGRWVMLGSSGDLVTGENKGKRTKRARIEERQRRRTLHGDK